MMRQDRGHIQMVCVGTILISRIFKYLCTQMFWEAHESVIRVSDFVTLVTFEGPSLWHIRKCRPKLQKQETPNLLVNVLSLCVQLTVYSGFAQENDKEFWRYIYRTHQTWKRNTRSGRKIMHRTRLFASFFSLWLSGTSKSNGSCLTEHTIMGKFICG